MANSEIACNINAHLALKGLEYFLCDSIQQFSLMNIFLQATQIAQAHLPRESSRHGRWLGSMIDLTKTMWDIEGFSEWC